MRSSREKSRTRRRARRSSRCTSTAPETVSPKTNDGHLKAPTAEKSDTYHSRSNAPSTRRGVFRRHGAIPRCARRISRFTVSPPLYVASSCAKRCPGVYDRRVRHGHSQSATARNPHLAPTRFPEPRSARVVGRGHTNTGRRMNAALFSPALLRNCLG